MKLERSTYQKPLSLTGLGGGATSFNFAGGADAPAAFVLTLNDTSKPERVFDMKIGSDGSIYACGMTQISGCGDTGLVFKTDASGNIKWQRYLCNNGAFYGITLDSSDNVIVVARSSSGGYAGNVVKYNSSGVLQWQKRLTNSSHYPNFNSVDVDSSDNIYATGYLQLTSGGNGTYRPLVVKINSSGVLQWFRIFKGMYLGQELDYFYSVYDMDSYGCTVDSSANVYITGRINAQSQSGAYAAKINSSGTPQWTTVVKHSSQTGIGFGINVDGSGNVYICGSGTSAAEYGNQGADAMVAKFNSSGTYQWINFFGYTVSGDEAKGVVTDSSGNVYVTGMYNAGNSTNLGLFIMKFYSSPPYSGASYVKYTNGHSVQFENSLRNFSLYDTSRSLYGNAITLDSDENVYVGGLTNRSTQNWGNSDYEAVIAKVPNDGTLTGTYSFGGSNFIYEADGTSQYNINSYYFDINTPSNYTQNGGNYQGFTNISFTDTSNLYSCPFTTSTFTDSTTSMTSAITPFE